MKKSIIKNWLSGNMLFKAVLLLLCVTVSFTGFGLFNINAETAADTDKAFTDDSTVVENDYYILSAESGSAGVGSFTVTRKSDGKVWRSNPVADSASSLTAGDSESEIFAQLFCTLYNPESKLETSTNSYVASDYGKNVEIKSNGTAIKITYFFEEYGIKIPITVALDEQEITASINSDEISENGDTVIMDIGLLPYFFCGDNTEDGQMLVPDGSGAIISFNNGKTNAAVYSQPLYGTDLDYYKQTETTLTQKAHLPVFGIIKPSASVLAIVDKGDGACTVKARVSGMFNDYNIAYGNFKLRTRDILVMSDSKGNTMNGEKFDLEHKMFNTAEIRYCLLGENQSYYSLAKEYGKHLEITADSIDTIPQTYIEAYAGCMKEVSFLGIPLSIYYPLTTVDELTEIVSGLEDTGNSKVSVIYRNADKALSVGKMQTKLRLRGSLGKLSELKELKNSLDGRLYYEYNPFYVTKSGNGFFKKFHSSKRISQDLMTESTYLKSTYYADDAVPVRYIVNPDVLGKFSEKTLVSAEKNNISLAFTSLGNTLYTNFDDKKYSSRDDTKKAITDVLEKSEGVIYSPNAYALAFSNSLVDLPTEASDFDIEDGAVPFYQLALNGLCDYSVESINLSDNRQKQFLLALATASSLKFTVTDERIDDEQNIEYTNLYGVCYASCSEEIKDMKKAAETVYSEIGTRIIKDFYSPEKGVWCTVFENGKTLFVNTLESNTTVQNTTIPAMGYLIK